MPQEAPSQHSLEDHLGHPFTHKETKMPESWLGPLTPRSLVAASRLEVDCSAAVAERLATCEIAAETLKLKVSRSPYSKTIRYFSNVFFE